MGAFQVGGLDRWRMPANADHGRELTPAEKLPRSDDVDVQPGEVEWRRGSLQFPEWSNRLGITATAVDSRVREGSAASPPIR